MNYHSHSFRRQHFLRADHCVQGNIGEHVDDGAWDGGDEDGQR